jgi:hypothetical protein
MLTVRTSLLFFIIAIIATMEYFADAVTVVVPGWHTTILPPMFYVSIFILASLYVQALGYFVLELKKKHVAKKWILFHLATTLFYFVYTNWPSLGTLAYEDESSSLALMAPFFLGQLVFVVIFIRAFVKK